MGIMNTCAKCGAVICACGFPATLAVFVLGGGQPPPSRAAAAIASATTSTILTTTVSTGGVNATAFLTVPDQITGKVYSAVWPEAKHQREPTEVQTVRLEIVLLRTP
jgi:hypothetical protein